MRKKMKIFATRMSIAMRSPSAVYIAKNIAKIIAAPVTLLLVLLGALSGCTHISTAGSMQVDVDVYKGPLVQAPEIQWAQLLRLARPGLCPLMTSMEADIRSIIAESAAGVSPGALSADKRQKLSLYLLEVAACGAQMYKHAYAQALLRDETVHHLGDTGPRNKTATARDAVAVVTTSPAKPAQPYDYCYWANGELDLCGDLAAQLMARSDTLHKLLRAEEGRMLPLSVFLRDAGASAFADYCLMNYKHPRCHDNGLQVVTRDLFGDVEDDAMVRANMARALIADQYWARINQVYASGVGDVRMAFVKDDIGNWTLKSFGNEPGSLLDAYASLTTTVIGTAAKLASGDLSVAKVPGAALDRSEQLLQLASKAGLGATAQGNGGDVPALNRLRDGLAADLQTLLQRQHDETTAQAANIKQAETAVGNAQTQVTAAQTAFEAAYANLFAADNTRPKDYPAFQQRLKEARMDVDSAERAQQRAYLHLNAMLAANDAGAQDAAVKEVAAARKRVDDASKTLGTLLQLEANLATEQQAVARAEADQRDRVAELAAGKAAAQKARVALADELKTRLDVYRRDLSTLSSAFVPHADKKASTPAASVPSS